MYHGYSEASHHNILTTYYILLYIQQHRVGLQAPSSSPPPRHTHTHYQPIVLVVHTYHQLIVLSTVHLRVLQQGNNPRQQQEGRSPCRPERSKGSAPAHPRSSAAPAAEFLHATSNTETQVRRRLMLYFCSSWLVTYSLLTGK